MARTNIYSVHYRETSWQEERYIYVSASNKQEAYLKAYYNAIPRAIGGMPYSAWVDNVTYQNGNVHHFNTCEGKPF